VAEPFWYKKGRMYCEDVPVADIVRKLGTPLYLYSQSALVHQYRVFDEAFAPVPHLICYAVKANSNLAILSLFRALGSGFDVVSGGELRRAFAAGMDPKRIVFSGVGKTVDEIDLGLCRGILQFNIESAAELMMVAARARALHRIANVALRVNPDVDSHTHPYISTGTREHKFGIAFDQALPIYRRARRSRHLRITGVACHIGSQITVLEPFLSALGRIKEIFRCLRAEGVSVSNLDLGGGLGIVYHDEVPPRPAEYARAIIAAVRDLDCRLLLEPGRAIAGNAGILVTRVLVTKQTGARNFVVVDAGMNDMMRPSLYGAHHRVQAVTLTRRAEWKADLVGPICESGDFLARDRNMTRVRANELLAIMSAGAYGFVLSSNYNTRARAAEVLVRGSRIKVIRRRESFPELVRGEALRPL